VAYEGHDGMVRSLAVHPCGEWLATASSDNTVRIWEVASGRCYRVIKFAATATALAWNPKHLLLSVAADETLFFVDPGLDLTCIRFLELSSKEESHDMEEPDLLKVLKAQDRTGDEEEMSKDETAALTRTTLWKEVEKEDPLYAMGCRLKIACDMDVQQLTWHIKGSYCAAVSPKAKAPSNQCIIHSLNAQKSMRPFSKLKGGQVQACAFHPSKPHFFVATKTGVRIFDLQKQGALKQLVSGAKWISSITMHPSGDHCVCGSYDRRIVWFDMDFGSKPYKTLQYHDKAVRRVAFHQGDQPLMASCSDDATISVMHTKVYSDLMKCPLVVPVKRLREHAVHQGLGVLDCQWHPVQPWLFSAGADHRVFMWA
jgi:ribosome biogenesis protein ERB1